MSISIQSLSSTAFAFHCPDFVDLYIDAMGYSPTLRHSRISVWRRAVMESGFTAVCAVESDESHSYTYGDGIAGVAYGFLGRREHWWNRQIRRGLRNAKATSLGMNASMPEHYFELAEIHVSPTRKARASAISYSRHYSTTCSQQQFCSPRRKYPTSQTPLFRFIDATVSTTYYATFIFKATPGLLPSSRQSSTKIAQCSTSVNALRHAHDRFPKQGPCLSYGELLE